jgi:hypothetical protein
VWSPTCASWWRESIILEGLSDHVQTFSHESRCTRDATKPRGHGNRVPIEPMQHPRRNRARLMLYAGWFQSGIPVVTAGLRGDARLVGGGFGAGGTAQDQHQRIRCGAFFPPRKAGDGAGPLTSTSRGESSIARPGPSVPSQRRRRRRRRRRRATSHVPPFGSRKGGKVSECESEVRRKVSRKGLPMWQLNWTLSDSLCELTSLHAYSTVLR